MSKETTNLKLFQYDPETDNWDTTTFNIQQCLNNNWDKIDLSVGKNTTDISNIVSNQFNVTLLSTNWQDDTANSGYWKYRITDATVKANTIVDFAVQLPYLEIAMDSEMQNVSRSFNGYYEFYSKNKLNSNIIMDIKKITQVGDL